MRVESDLHLAREGPVNSGDRKALGSDLVSGYMYFSEGLVPVSKDGQLGHPPSPPGLAHSPGTLCVERLQTRGTKTVSQIPAPSTRLPSTLTRSPLPLSTHPGVHRTVTCFFTVQ
ncbi:hypothetical protein C0Q70_17759 [Pomacea canaliculata]|uniref:Uncharacterized protein n=1 Tax=Pomacea canaliculata TaxID=400727 RepID=A0A2T7NLC2_POMCA|nr:hypothetical protein C0Q70_17759 [Pomacea canaliculata]